MAEPRLVSNKWEIIRVLGHGGMGSVYEVRHTTLGIRRALKTLHRHLAEDPDVVKRFLREGWNEARLDHPNIVRVYDFDTDPEFGTYLTMELVEGQDVKQLMQQGALPLHEVVRIGCEVASALDYAHSAAPPVVHRDIKPANILIAATTGLAKVTDFGIAKELADRETGMTGTQGFIGTIRYAAPEQIRDDVKIDGRCDLYSLGVMLYEMYSGQSFLESEKPADIYRRTMVEPDWQPAMRYPSPPPQEFAEVVRWCLQRKREDRVPSARELLKCLRLCIEGVADPGHRLTFGVGAHVQAPAGLTGGPESLGEAGLTAVTIVPLVVDEEATTIVGLRAKITRLGQDLNAEAEAFSRLYAAAAAIGVPMGGLPTPHGYASQLAEIDDEVDAAADSRDRERLAHAFSRCERLREEFGAGTSAVRRRLSDGVPDVLADLRTTWDGLAARQGAALSSEARTTFESLLETGRMRTEAADWPAVGAVLQQARAVVGEARPALEGQAATTSGAQPAPPSPWRRRVPIVAGVALVAVVAVWQVVSRTRSAPLATPAEQPLASGSQVAASNQPGSPQVGVEIANRPPVLTSLVPDPNTAIDRKIGDSVLLKAEASDADPDDRLTYRWTIDGKPAGGDAPQLNVKVAANHAVGLSVSDGTDHTDAAWRIAAVAPLAFEVSPKRLDSVRFKSSTAFKLIPPRDLAMADVSLKWTLDGRTVSDAPAFTLESNDPTWVRAAPLKLTAMATDRQGRDFSYDWKVTVLPPIPEIQSATPTADQPIEAESGQSLTFQLAAAPPIGNQQLTYLFGPDDQPVERSGKPQFEFRVTDEKEHRVTARVEDNYRQASKQTVTWRIQGSDILSQARKWVGTFQEARQNREAQKEGQLRDLSAAEIARLQDAYGKQKDLQVSFTAPQIDKLASNRARAAFTMTQSFAAPSGDRISGRLACEFTLTRTEGRLREERRPQGPCVPVP